MFETTLNIDLPYKDIAIEGDDEDGLGYLNGKGFDFVGKKAMAGTLAAHAEGGVPNLVFNLPALNLYYLGKLLYIFETACATSSFLLGVNPFDQPGVEAYKTKMFELLKSGE